MLLNTEATAAAPFPPPQDAATVAADVKAPKPAALILGHFV